MYHDDEFSCPHIGITCLEFHPETFTTYQTRELLLDTDLQYEDDEDLMYYVLGYALFDCLDLLKQRPRDVFYPNSSPMSDLPFEFVIDIADEIYQNYEVGPNFMVNYVLSLDDKDKQEFLKHRYSIL